MAIEVDGKIIETDERGYLINPDDWNERVAEVMAEKEGIQLTERHWDVIRYLREQYYNHGGEQPNTRTIVKAMQSLWGDKSVNAKTLYQLFPLDPSKQGARIAGLPETKRKGGY
ncbi:MAG: TusE/DsrC/DsvC family sulfur relay protein [Gammaproteobacteria bacterium]|nr:MAG: TusE/DsrC/DsvC family sulfur relay protein [Gammaproteobacteria bacterium]